MAEPRKRAPKKAGRPPAERTRAAGGPPDTAPEWTLRDDRTRPAPPPLTRLELPASGLAEDILALPDAALVAPGPAELAPRDDPAADAAAPAHSLSFFAAPAREEKKAAEASEHLATFLLAGEEYGVDVRLVQEIIRVGEITQVPRAPDFIKGVINLRGRIIPVVDLKRKLSLGVVELTREARIVVVKLKERLIGLLVDGASQVLKVPVAVIEAAPEEVVEIDTNAVRGVAKLEKRLIILIDLLRILAPELRDAGPSA
jgi:purine-binding chemotaxis protein CheW